MVTKAKRSPSRRQRRTARSARSKHSATAVGEVAAQTRSGGNAGQLGVAQRAGQVQSLQAFGGQRFASQPGSEGAFSDLSVNPTDSSIVEPRTALQEVETPVASAATQIMTSVEPTIPPAAVSSSADQAPPSTTDASDSANTQPSIENKPNQRTEQVEQKAEAGTTEGPAPESNAQNKAEKPTRGSSTTKVEKLETVASAQVQASSGGDATPQASAAAKQANESSEGESTTVSPARAVAPVVRSLGKRAASLQEHTPTEESVSGAKAAGTLPAIEQQREAANQTVTQIDNVEQVDFDRNSFKARLRAELQRAVPDPRNERQAADVAEHGGDRTSAAIAGELQTQTASATGGMAAASSPESQAQASEQPAPQAVTLAPESVGPQPAEVSASSVVPAPLSAQTLDYSDNSADADALMAEHDISEDQLQRGNEPEFNATLQSRAEAENHTASAEPTFRESEQSIRGQTRSGADQSVSAGLEGFFASRTERVGNVAAQQTATQTQESAERLRVTTEVERIKNETSEAVQNILESIQSTATAMFQTGLQVAEIAYEAVFEEEKGGFWSRLADKVTFDDGKERLDRAFALARERYDEIVTGVIDRVADFVEAQLAAARTRVEQGKAKIDEFIAGLDESSQKYGEEARASVAADFEAMTGSIDEQRDALVNTLVDTYRQSQQRLEATEARLREENKGFWARVYDATIGAVKKILEFKNLLLSVLAAAAGVVGAIIKDPIGFLGNLINGIRTGLNSFVANIMGHLQKGLMGWLFGTLAKAGIQIPEKLDMQGVLSIATQILGLTYANIRQRAVRIVGEKLVSRMEQGVEIFKILMTKGIAGLWEMLVEKLVAIKEMVVGQIQEYIATSVIKAGITWIIGLLNPAAAFIKACKMIYDIVKFFIERGRQIVELVQAIIGSVAAIVSGNISAMAKAVEGALVKALPVAISFLAALLGLGGISNKIREIIQRIQTPVNKAIDWVINKAVVFAKRGMSAIGLGGQSDEHDQKVAQGLQDLEEKDAAQAKDGRVSHEKAEKVAAEVKRDHPVFSKLEVVDGGDSWDYKWAASPEDTKDTKSTKVESSEADDKVPRTSAKGLGNQADHGSQVSRNHKGPKIHHLISEHVLPFGIAKQLWAVLNQDVPERQSYEDRRQRTITIYAGAADRKTKSDLPLIQQFKDELRSKGIPERFKTAFINLHGGGDEQTAKMEIADLLSQTIAAMEKIRSDAVHRTSAAISNESKDTSEEITEPHAERRGPEGRPEAETPNTSAIESVAEIQLDQVILMARDWFSPRAAGRIRDNSADQGHSGTLNGKSFQLTGRFPFPHSQTSISKVILANGGRVTGGKNVDYLLVGASPSESKLESSAQRISLDQLMSMINAKNSI